jgi:hypothetical protein
VLFQWFSSSANTISKGFPESTIENLLARLKPMPVKVD